MVRRLFGFETKVTILYADGEVYESPWVHNALMNEGEKNILDSYLRNQFHPTQFFARLFADTPEETDSLASLSGEPGGLVGYAPKQILRSATAAGWPTLENASSGGDFQAESVEVQWNAIGNWPATSHGVLATTSDNTGLLIDGTALPQPRQLKSADVYKLKMRPRLS